MMVRLPERDDRLARSGAMLAAARSVDDVVAVLSETSRKIIGADGIAVVLRDDALCHYVAEDAIEPLWTGCRFPMEECVSGWAMLHNETVIVPDIAFDARVPVAPYQNKAIRSLVIAPIGSPTPIAAIGAYWCAMTLLEEPTVSRIEEIARQATRVLARLTSAPVEGLTV